MNICCRRERNRLWDVRDQSHYCSVVLLGSSLLPHSWYRLLLREIENYLYFRVNYVTFKLQSWAWLVKHFCHNCYLYVTRISKSRSIHETWNIQTLLRKMNATLSQLKGSKVNKCVTVTRAYWLTCKSTSTLLHFSKVTFFIAFKPSSPKLNLTWLNNWSTPKDGDSTSLLPYESCDSSKWDNDQL